MDQLNIVKMDSLPKLINRNDAICIKILAGFFVQIHKFILKFISNTQSKQFWKRKMKFGYINYTV